VLSLNVESRAFFAYRPRHGQPSSGAGLVCARRA